MKSLINKSLARRKGLILIERTDFDPPAAETALKRIGLLADPKGELTKSDREHRAIAKTISVLNDIRRGLGLEPIRLDPTHIHVQGECAFAQQWPNHGQAFMTCGHVYLPRLILFVYSLQYLTHEMTHLSSFQAAIDPECDKDRAIVSMRNGLSTFVDCAPFAGDAFRDLNEAVTEIIAAEIRCRIAAETDLVEPEFAEGLVRGHPCPVQVRLAEGLIEFVGDYIGANESRRLLLTDYFEQTDTFLSKLSEIDKDAVGRLEIMATNAEALAVAQDLGLDDAVADIERLRLIRRRR